MPLSVLLCDCGEFISCFDENFAQLVLVRLFFSFSRSVFDELFGFFKICRRKKFEVKFCVMTKFFPKFY